MNNPARRRRSEELREPATLVFDTTEAPTLGLPAPTSPINGTPLYIGDYRIVRKLGEGGMGVVYEAEQQHPRRPVALKVIRGGQFVGALHVQLFQREVQALALLKHLGIAAIYDVGQTEDGQHYFAMELAPGVPLMEYVKQRKAQPEAGELRQRLELFLKLAQVAWDENRLEQMTELLERQRSQPGQVDQRGFEWQTSRRVIWRGWPGEGDVGGVACGQ